MTLEKKFPPVKRDLERSQWTVAQISFFDEYLAKTFEDPKHPKNRIFDVDGNAITIRMGVISSIEQEPNRVEIGVIKAEKQNQGGATQALRFLTYLAGKHGVSITLDAIPDPECPLSAFELKNKIADRGFRRAGGTRLVFP